MNTTPKLAAAEEAERAAMRAYFKARDALPAAAAVKTAEALLDEAVAAVDRAKAARDTAQDAYYVARDALDSEGESLPEHRAWHEAREARDRVWREGEQALAEAERAFRAALKALPETNVVEEDKAAVDRAEAALDAAVDARIETVAALPEWRAYQDAYEALYRVRPKVQR